MKKLLLSLAAVAMSGSIFAESYTLYSADDTGTWTEVTDANSKVIAYVNEVTSNGAKFTITYKKNSSGSFVSPTQYTPWRMYQGTSIEIESNDVMFNKVTFNASATNYNKFKLEDGNVWSGSSDGTVFTATYTTGSSSFSIGNSAQCRISSLVVEGTAADPTAVKAPKFDLIKSAEGYAVSITCDTEGAEIYYTSSEDGDAATPTKQSTKYTAPVDVFFQTQFKAIAYVGDKASSVVTFNANPPYVLENFMPLLDFDGEAQVDIRGNVKAVYQNGDYLYVADTYNNGMLLYGNTDSKLENGNVIDGLTGTFTVYNGQTEIKNYELGAISAGTAVEPATITLSDLDGSLLNRYVKIAGLTIENKSGASYTITDGDGATGILYNKFTNANKYNVVDVPEGTGFTVIGFVAKNYENIQIVPVSVEGGVVMEQVEAPQFTPEAGELEAGTNITIVCPTEGATIYYTVDGTVPTAESTKYVSPIVFEDAMTVKAIAVKDGMLDSEVVSAVYTLYDPNAPVVSEYTFDFTNSEWLENAGVEIPTVASTGTDIAGRSFTVNPVTFAVAESSENNKARIWRMTDKQGGGIQLRVYKTDSFTISVSDNYKLISIEFGFGSNKALSLAEGAKGEYSNDVWTVQGNEQVETVSFVPTATTYINTVKVIYDILSGVADVESDNDIAPVYYNLQGVRVANPENGLYIEVKGNKSRKVIF